MSPKKISKAKKHYIDLSSSSSSSSESDDSSSQSDCEVKPKKHFLISKINELEQEIKKLSCKKDAYGTFFSSDPQKVKAKDCFIFQYNKNVENIFHDCGEDKIKICVDGVYLITIKAIFDCPSQIAWFVNDCVVKSTITTGANQATESNILNLKEGDILTLRNHESKHKIKTYISNAGCAIPSNNIIATIVKVAEFKDCKPCPPKKSRSPSKSPKKHQKKSRSCSKSPKKHPKKSRSCSKSPKKHQKKSRSCSKSSKKCKPRSCSKSPKKCKPRSCSKSPKKSRSRSHSRSRSCSSKKSPKKSRSQRSHSRSRSCSPKKSPKKSRSQRSHSKSPRRSSRRSRSRSPKKHQKKSRSRSHSRSPRKSSRRSHSRSPKKHQKKSISRSRSRSRSPKK